MWSREFGRAPRWPPPPNSRRSTCMSAQLESATSSIDPTQRTEWRPGTFALQDAWFPVAHSPKVTQKPVLRLVHSRRFHIWRDDSQIHATDYHPLTKRNAPLTA